MAYSQNKGEKLPSDGVLKQRVNSDARNISNMLQCLDFPVSDSESVRINNLCQE